MTIAPHAVTSISKYLGLAAEIDRIMRENLLPPNLTVAEWSEKSRKESLCRESER